MLQHLPASFCFLNSPFCLYPLYLAWSLVAADSEHKIKSLSNLQRLNIDIYQLICTHPAHVYISQKHPPWRKESSDDGWIFWCYNKEETVKTCAQLFVALSLFALSSAGSAVLTVPFCTHLASSPDVEPALPLHQQALLSSEARWLGTGVYICQMQQTTSSTCLKCTTEELLEAGFLIWKSRLCAPSYLFRKTSNLRLYAKPARLTLRCSIRPRYFTWCRISASSNRPVFTWRRIQFKHLHPVTLNSCMWRL